MATYRIHPIVTTRYGVMKVTEDAAELVEFTDPKTGEKTKHFLNEFDAKMALEKLVEKERGNG